VNLLGSDVDHHSDPSPVGQYGVGGLPHPSSARGDHGFGPDTVT
jgi:hypothetical protein